MKRIVIIVSCLIVGMLLGYTTGYFRYEPQLRRLLSEATHLTTQVSNLLETVSSLEATERYNRDKISSLENTISSHENSISDQNQTISAQVDTIGYQRTEINSLESLNEAQRILRTILQTQLDDANAATVQYKGRLNHTEQRLDNILEITVRQLFAWKGWTWEMPISLSLYVDYFERPRPRSFANYIDLATDPDDDYYIQSLINGVKNATSSYSDTKRLNWIISFVQNLPYTVDLETTPYNEYPRYPMETLFDRGGDCEDTSILVAALLDELGYDVALIYMQKAKHMAVGVNLPNAYGTYYEYQGKKYYFLETTGVGFTLGQFPSSITEREARLYPLSD